MVTKRKLIVIVNIVLLLACSLVEATDRVKITGEYTYTYGDSESLIEAKDICYSMAVRNAVESYKTFVIATATVKDYQLIKDLIQTISSGYVEDLKVIKEAINGRTVYTKVRGYIVPAIVDKVLKREVQRMQGKELAGLAENKYIKILRVEKTTDYVIFYYKVLLSTCPNNIYSHIQDGGKLVVNYYDWNGDPIDGESKSIGSFVPCKVKGELGRIKFSRTGRDKSFRFWLAE